MTPPGTGASSRTIKFFSSENGSNSKGRELNSKTKGSLVLGHRPCTRRTLRVGASFCLPPGLELSTSWVLNSGQNVDRAFCLFLALKATACDDSMPGAFYKVA